MSDLRAVERALNTPNPADPPTFLEMAAAEGFQATCDRINRWADNNYAGDWQDLRYAESPRYTDLRGGAA